MSVRLYGATHHKITHKISTHKVGTMRLGLLLLFLLSLFPAIYAQNIRLFTAIDVNNPYTPDSLDAQFAVMQKEPVSINSLSKLLLSTYDAKTEVSRTNRARIDIYVMLNSGIYLYKEDSNELVMFLDGNHKLSLGDQEIAEKISIALFYVAKHVASDVQRRAIYLDGCSIGAVVYQQAVAENLSIVSRRQIPREKLERLLRLQSNQEMILSQIFGRYEVKKAD